MFSISELFDLPECLRAIPALAIQCSLPVRHITKLEQDQSGAMERFYRTRTIPICIGMKVFGTVSS